MCVDVCGERACLCFSSCVIVCACGSRLSGVHLSLCTCLCVCVNVYSERDGLCYHVGLGSCVLDTSVCVFICTDIVPHK